MAFTGSARPGVTFYFKDHLKQVGVLGLVPVTQHLLNLLFIPFLLVPGSW